MLVIFTLNQSFQGARIHETIYLQLGGKLNQGDHLYTIHLPSLYGKTPCYPASQDSEVTSIHFDSRLKIYVAEHAPPSIPRDMPPISIRRFTHVKVIYCTRITPDLQPRWHGSQG